jgi:hypothetical protein
MAKPKGLTTAEVMAILDVNYAEKNGFALLREVGNSTGYGCNRHADAVVLSLWPSRGIYLHGYEVKVSRQDWLHELRQPKKSAEVQQYCGRWNLVVGDQSIVDLAEVPETWGLIVAEKVGNRLRTVKAAPPLEAKPLDLGFIAAVIRRVAEQQKESLQCEYQRGRDDGVADAPKITAEEIQHEAGQIGAAYQRLKESIAAFERDSGVKIDMWNGGQVGKMFAEFQRIRTAYGTAETKIDALEREAKDLLKRLSVWRETAAMVEQDIAKAG